MKTLIFGAGPLGSLYAHLFFQAGNDVTIFARGPRYEFIKNHGVVLVDEMNRTRVESQIPVVKTLTPKDEYDLVVVLIRKNKLPGAFEVLSTHEKFRNILFMGNNACGFDAYLRHLPREKLLFGFPGAGGGIEDQVVHFVDSKKPGAGRLPVTLGEIQGKITERTGLIRSLFKTSGIPVSTTRDMDGWLKYHIALIIPMACGLLKHQCDNKALGNDPQTIRTMVRAAREGGRVLKELGFSKRQPFQYNLFYWFPEVMLQRVFQKLLHSTFAEIAFARHAHAARDEMCELADEYRTLKGQTSVATPNLDSLTRCLATPG